MSRALTIIPTSRMSPSRCTELDGSRVVLENKSADRTAEKLHFSAYSRVIGPGSGGELDAFAGKWG